MLYAWFQPWWRAYVVELEVYAVAIFPYGMEINMGGYEYWLAGAEDIMPGWFTPFMWVYLGLCMIALLFSLFASGEKRVGLGKLRLSLPQALIGGVGLTYIVVVVAAVLVIVMNLSSFYNTPLQGSILITMSDFENSLVDTGLEFGYWLACGVGPLIIVLALFRNKIRGKP